MKSAKGRKTKSKDTPTWYPTPDYIEGSHVERLIRAMDLPVDLNRPEAAYKAFFRKSVEDPETFWRTALDLMGIEWFEPYTRVLDASQGAPWPRWFVGGRLNLAHNAVTRHARGAKADHPAIIWEGEDGATVSLTYGELTRRVGQTANALRELGVGRGDRVGIFLPMLPETAISALAIAQIGAIFIPVFSGYGPEAVATRLRDCGAKLLITADGFYRRGQVVPMGAFAREAVRIAGCVERVLTVRRINADKVEENQLYWDRIVCAQSASVAVESMESMDPFMLIYTSGTTGRPKGTVHYHAGFPLKGAQDMAHLFDLREKEVMFWFTDMGWMMGPWAILGSLTLGATAVLYEGTPDYPGPDRLWRMVERHRVTHLGVSPTLVRSLMPHGSGPIEGHDLSSLRVLGSTGELWNPEAYQWLFENAGKKRLPIINYSGGTEISGGILGCTAFRPINRCGFNTPAPGIDAAVLDDGGKPVVGAVGELAVRNVWPGMTKGFWQDPERYLETYWKRFEGTWVHGDWAMVDEAGHWLLFGRSDDTLKVAGKRVGPAEIESAATEHPAVKEVAAIGVPDKTKGEVPVVFAILLPGFEPSENLAESVANKIAEVLGKPLKPRRVHLVSDLPKTRNAKIMRRVVRAVYLGQDPGDLSALENQATIQQIPRADD
jgi:acetyl-CoA synthetase